MKGNGLVLIALLVLAPVASAEESALPGTEPLQLDRPLDEFMVEGLRRFCLRELAASRDRREARWQRDFSSPALYAASVTPNRERFRTLIGAVDPRRTRTADSQASFQLQATLDRSSMVAKNPRVTVHSVRWPVLDGVTAEGLILVPQSVRCGVVALPDADWTPEMFCGVWEGIPEAAGAVRRLAESGCLVVIPTLISRKAEHSGHARVRYTNQPHREFIYRQAFEVGRHIIGYEVQKALAAVDLLERSAPWSREERAAPLPIGVMGVGEGGLLALHAAALDPRVQVCWISGYFQEREAIWREPIYRNVWGLLTEFGDAELAGLIAPRRLVVEACTAVEIAGPPTARAGRAQVAAPGVIETCPPQSVRREFARAASIYRRLGVESRLSLAISGANGDGPPGSDRALQAFAKGLGLNETLSKPMAWPRGALRDAATTERIAAAREKRQFDQLQSHVQKLIHRSHQARNTRWRFNLDAAQSEEQTRDELRTWVHEELIGKLSRTPLPHRPRSRQLCEGEDYVGYEVVLDVLEDVVAGGILLMPKDIQEGGKRPVVVCQHGLEGLARDTFSDEPRAFAAYKAFAQDLVKRGYIVYSPQNPYRGGDRFRVLQRMSNPLKRSLFTYIIAQHERTLAWLATLPQVDAERIAFYGLSYGGKTAMRVPPFVQGYSLAICSGDFTDWPRTIASNDERHSYLFTSEYEIPEWNLAHVASYAELAMLIFPRPFMVEAGHRDGGQPTAWVASEFGKVRRHYDQLGLGDRAELEFFDGPHTIHGKGTFRFLQRHLKWPE